jgi:hypothetical protein
VKVSRAYRLQQFNDVLAGQNRALRHENAEKRDSALMRIAENVGKST